MSALSSEVLISPTDFDDPASAAALAADAPEAGRDAPEDGGGARDDGGTGWLGLGCDDGGDAPAGAAELRGASSGSGRSTCPIASSAHCFQPHRRPPGGASLVGLNGHPQYSWPGRLAEATLDERARTHGCECTCRALDESGWAEESQRAGGRERAL